jgi:hypothetical protein
MQSTTPSGRLAITRADDWIRTSMSSRKTSTGEMDAFLSRATSAISTSVRIRTPCGSFGGCLLSQEHHSCKAAWPLTPGGGRHSSNSTVQYASLMNLDQLSIRPSCRA